MFRIGGMRFAYSIMALVLVTSAAADVSAEGAEFKVGRWSGEAHTEDSEFSHCSITAPYPDGLFLVFAMTRDSEFRIGIASNAWDLPDEQVFDLRLSVDGRWSEDTSAFAVSSVGVMSELPLSSMDVFKRGRALRVDAARQSWSFDLTGTHRALTALERCVAANQDISAGRFANPFSDGGSNPFAAVVETDISDQPLLDRDTFENFMSTLNLDDFTLLETAPKDWEWAHYVWLSGSSIGAYLDVLGEATLDMDEIVGTYVGGIFGECENESASGVTLTERFGGTEVRQIVILCQVEGFAYYMHSTLAYSPQDGILQMFVQASTLENRDDGLRASDRIVDGLRLAYER